MLKKEFIETAAERCGLSKVDTEKAMDAIFGVIIDVVEADDSVMVTDFGAFKKKRSKARIGINPSTKERMQIEAKTGVSFKAAKKVKERLNK